MRAILFCPVINNKEIMRVRNAVSRLTRQAREIRADQKITVSDLVKNVNGSLSSSTIRRIENASKTGYNPSFKTLVKLANGLKVAPVVLFRLLAGN